MTLDALKSHAQSNQSIQTRVQEKEEEKENTNLAHNSLENVELGTQTTHSTQQELKRRRQRKIDNINRDIQNNNTVVSKDVVKVIQYDDKSLSLTYKEYLLFNEVTKFFTLVDNIFRIILPITFFIIIGVIFSNESDAAAES